MLDRKTESEVSIGIGMNLGRQYKDEAHWVQNTFLVIPAVDSRNYM